MSLLKRLLEYANCGSMALDVLAGRFKYYVLQGALHVFVILYLGKYAPGMARFIVWRQGAGLGKCNSITGLDQEQSYKWEC
jgi:hypothetical protein